MTTRPGPSIAVMPTYARVDVVFDRGEGAWIVSTTGGALSRLRQRRGGERARARASETDRCTDGAGQQAVAQLQPLSRCGPGETRRAVVRGDVCRPGLLLQFGRGSVRGRDQAGAAVSLCERPARTLAAGDVQGRVPRPHARHHRLGRQRQASGRLRTSGRWLRHGAVWRPRGNREGHRAGDGRASWSSPCRARAASTSRRPAG